MVEPTAFPAVVVQLDLIGKLGEQHFQEEPMPDSVEISLAKDQVIDCTV